MILFRFLAQCLLISTIVIVPTTQSAFAQDRQRVPVPFPAPEPNFFERQFIPDSLTGPELLKKMDKYKNKINWFLVNLTKEVFKERLQKICDDQDQISFKWVEENPCDQVLKIKVTNYSMPDFDVRGRDNPIQDILEDPDTNIDISPEQCYANFDKKHIDRYCEVFRFSFELYRIKGDCHKNTGSQQVQ